MSTEANHLQRAGSPAPLGRSSPVNPRNRPQDDGQLQIYAERRANDSTGPSKNDKAIRRYAAGVDRALSLFDTALQEWADYLPFLGRLLKVRHRTPSLLYVG